MATIFDLQDRGLRYGVIVDAAATPATLAGIERAGLRYKVEVASGITAADRAALDRRGLQYFVPVSATVSMADRAILERQGLRYAVQVDATVLPADLAALERQGLSYFVEVDSSGNAIATAAGGGLLLVDETNGFATDFTHAVDAERVALKTAGATTYSTVDGFYTQSGTSPKMVYDVAGVLGWSPHNLVLQSAMGRVGFTWAGNGSTQTGGHADPAGGTQALQVVVTDNAPGLSVQQYIAGLGIGTTYTASAWCKGTLGQQIYFSANALVAAASVLVTFTGAWQRVTSTYTASAADAYVTFECYNRGGGAHLPIVTFQCWGAQLNRGTVPTTYLPTTTAARFGLALDYDPVTHAARGLLCESAATNLCLQSSSLDAANWSKGTGTIALNAVSAPNGVVEGDGYILPVGATGTNLFQTITVANAATYTFSAYLKNGPLGNNWFHFAAVTGSVYRVWFNLATGAKGTSVGSPTSYTITSAGNGWYRADITFLTASTVCSCYLIPDTGDGAITAVTGDGVKASFYNWGAQLEAGTVATSHIPTLAATVTRAADSYNATAASIGTSATAGSWWCENYLLEGASDRILIGQGATTVPLFFNNTAYEMVQSTLLYKLGPNVLNNVNKAMSTFTSGDRAITFNGLAPSTDAGATSILLAPTTIYLAGGAGGTGATGYIRKVRYLPRRPSNAEMVTMTT